MTTQVRFALFTALLVQALPAQQLLWQVPIPPQAPAISTVQYLAMGPFPDFNSDGYRDYLQLVLPNSFSGSNQQALQIASGADGSILWSTPQFVVSRFVHAGDLDGDGHPEIAILKHNGARWVEIHSTSASTVLWQKIGTSSSDFGRAMLGDIDVDGDGRSDFLIATSSNSISDVHVYDSTGSLLYTVPCMAHGRRAYSLCSMGDLDGDGRDDFVIGCSDALGRGVLVLVSGANGAVLRLSYSPTPGDYMTDHVSNLGDIDGDGVPDYGGFPNLSSTTGICMQFSGATGNVIRQWYDFGSSVIVGHDVDLDGVPDIVLAADHAVVGGAFGSTRARSGRDGTVLWRVDNFIAPPGSGYTNGSSGWGRHAAGLGVQPGRVYPTIAWMDLEWIASTTHAGRVRAFDTTLAGQGAITGAACSSTGNLPWIGARQTTNGARITIAKSEPGAVAFLNLAIAPQTTYSGLVLPIDLTPYGLPGCDLHVGPEAAVWRTLGTTGIDRGYAAVDLPFFFTTSALGTNVVAQWLVFDPTTLAYAATAKHELKGL